MKVKNPVKQTILKEKIRGGMYHIKDEEFIRTKVPMTKEEIRAISISKMEIKDTDICLDIGGGTGSVSIEMSRFAKNGHIYTVEQKMRLSTLLNRI